MDAVEAVELIRKERRGAINRRQLDFLRSYTPSTRRGAPCAVM